MRKIIAIKFIIVFILTFFSTTIVLIFKEKNLSVSDKTPSPQYRIKGNKNARIVIVEYSDFACPACAYMNEYLKNLLSYFPSDFVLYFKHLPLTNIHPNSFNAAVWAECVGMKENKFFEFGDILFKNRSEWTSSNDYIKLFEKYTKQVGADLNKVKECYKNQETVELVKSDIKKADEMRLDSTPTFFVNGRIAVGGSALIEEIKKEK
jgi:protein-disulfide isomerase